MKLRPDSVPRLGDGVLAKNRNALPSDHLSGKRRWTRQSRSIAVVCVGAGSTVRARTIDISRGGVLVEAQHDDVPPVGDGDLVPLAFLVSVAFADGMKVILGQEVSVRADVVRVTTSPVDRSFLRLGCRFRRALTRQQCARLGIDETDVPDPALDLAGDAEEGAGAPAPAAESLEVTARPGRRKSAASASLRAERRAPVE